MFSTFITMTLQLSNRILYMMLPHSCYFRTRFWLTIRKSGIWWLLFYVTGLPLMGIKSNWLGRKEVSIIIHHVQHKVPSKWPQVSIRNPWPVFIVEAEKREWQLNGIMWPKTRRQKKKKKKGTCSALIIFRYYKNTSTTRPRILSRLKSYSGLFVSIWKFSCIYLKKSDL